MKILVRRYSNTVNSKDNESFNKSMSKSMIENYRSIEPVTVYNSKTGKNETYFPDKSNKLII